MQWLNWECNVSKVNDADIKMAEESVKQLDVMMTAVKNLRNKMVEQGVKNEIQ